MHHGVAIEALAARFPQAFTWGIASSAFQIEGAAAQDGKGASIWDEFCRRDGVIADGSNGDVACDHYHRLDSDLDLIAALGVAAYRFSISWPRVQPAGSGPYNPQGLDFYERLIDGLLARGIEPFPTLYHWDLPAVLQREHGGWIARSTAQRFAEYAAHMARRFGDRLRQIATHNEPWVTATLGYESGAFAPGVKNRAAAAQASHHCLLSHGLAMQAIRAAHSGLEVGIVLNLSPVRPASDAVEDVAQARLDDGYLNRWYLDALLVGDYPADIVAHLGADAPVREAGDAVLIARPIDFLGVNYYHPIISSAARSFSPVSKDAEKVTDMGWEVAPAQLTQLLRDLQGGYRLPPILITENGAAFRDLISDGIVRDEDRQAYVEHHIAAVADALDLGVDVRGYYLWSLMDNFEWASGYGKRFGIYYVDYTTQLRTLKCSGAWYRDFAMLSGRRPRLRTAPQNEPAPI
jgi:beta-glucosidase